MSQYTKLRLSVWLICTSWIIPRKWRSPRANKLLDLAAKGKRRVEKALDIRKIVEDQEDLQLFLRQFMGWQRLWLFRHQKKRFLSLDQDLICEEDEHKLGRKESYNLLDWTARDKIDERLLKGLFGIVDEPFVN